MVTTVPSYQVWVSGPMIGRVTVIFLRDPVPVL